MRVSVLLYDEYNIVTIVSTEFPTTSDEDMKLADRNEKPSIGTSMGVNADVSDS